MLKVNFTISPPPLLLNTQSIHIYKKYELYNKMQKHHSTARGKDTDSTQLFPHNVIHTDNIHFNIEYQIISKC